ncbi:helix-turn-helix domain-containing protein [Sutterella sp.]|uniref:winged helix-turn-helix transcriptional regulator n=1 Tax=Sutterella sp. TaxID=1981025 RepID=UPI0026DF63E1|nr:helix-turn-helix domain-containing protein [Sutterella sp.]MDO5532598.1 helix-turn-helix domain-containing protein [Sutterella sp.]
MYQQKSNKIIKCPAEYGLSLFSGKWKLRIFCIINDRKNIRYSDLRSELPDISDPVLSSALKELIRDELIVRERFNEMPPRTTYRLSERGESAVPILQALCRWASSIYSDGKNELAPQCSRCREDGNAAPESTDSDEGK